MVFRVEVSLTTLRKSPFYWLSIHEFWMLEGVSLPILCSASLWISQNHRIQCWKGSLDIIWSKSFAQAGPPGARCPGPCPGRFWICPGKEIPQTFWAIFPVLYHPHSKEGFLHVQREYPMFQFVSIACCLLTKHHWKETRSVLYSTSLQVFVNLDKISPSLLFSRLNSPNSLSFSW